MSASTTRTRILGALRLALAAFLLIASLVVVIWRQGESHQTLRQLDRLRRDHAAARAEQAMLQRHKQRLESRGQIIEKAETDLHMRLPEGEEIFIVTEPGGGGP